MQSSPNRDNYIDILWDQINKSNCTTILNESIKHFLFMIFTYWKKKKKKLKGYHHNFQKYSSGYITSFNLPYDYDSIMHYSNNAFSVNGNITIVPKVKI